MCNFKLRVVQVVKIGIPRGLLFHEYGSLWNDYFTKLGIPVVISPETNKEILSNGTRVSVDESCLPLKIFLGHVQFLLDKCTHIFVPRIAQHYKDYYYCAKFAGLPDIVRNTFNMNESHIISPNIENKTFYTLLNACRTVAAQIGSSPVKSYYCYRQAVRNYKCNYNRLPIEHQNYVAVIGHSYLLHDPFFTQEINNVISSRGIKILTPDQASIKLLYNLSSEHHPDVYWQLSSKIVGAAQYFCTLPNVKGILVISSFGCGPDSLINEYIDNQILKISGKPFTFINLDEHTGNAGIITRVEAFLDLIEWRR